MRNTTSAGCFKASDARRGVMFATLGLVLPVFALILIGWAMGRSRIFPPHAVEVLNAFVVRLALPVLLFQFVAEADWPNLWQPGFVAAFALGIVIAFAGGVLLAPRGATVADRSIAGLAAAYANTAFLGVPIAQSLFGAVGLAAAVIASLLTVCAAFAVAILLVEIDLHRAKGWAGATFGVARSLIRNPLLIGPLIGAIWALTGAPLPDPAHRIAMLLGGAAAPVALVTIGLFLAGSPRGRGDSAPVTRLALLKLVGQPLATWGFALAFGVPAPWSALAVLIAALPTGTGPFMLARLYGREADVIGRVILATTLIGAITIPLLAVVLR